MYWIFGWRPVQARVLVCLSQLTRKTKSKLANMYRLNYLANMYRLHYLDEDLSKQECLSARDSASASVQPDIHNFIFLECHILVTIKSISAWPDKKICFLKVETQVPGSWDQQILRRGCCDLRLHRRSPHSPSLIWPLKKVSSNANQIYRILFWVYFPFLTFFPLSLLVLDLHPGLIVNRVPSHLSPELSKSLCTKKKLQGLEETSRIWVQRMDAKKFLHI